MVALLSLPWQHGPVDAPPGRKPEDKARPSERSLTELWGEVSTALDLATLIPLLGLGVPAVLVLALAEGAFAYAGVVVLLVGMIVFGVWVGRSGRDAELSPAALLVGIPLAGAAIYYLVRLLFQIAPG